MIVLPTTSHISAVILTLWSPLLPIVYPCYLEAQNVSYDVFSLLMSPTTHKKFPFHQFLIIVASPSVSLTVPDRPPYNVSHLSGHSDAVLPPSPETFVLFNKKLRAASPTKKEAI